MAKGGLKVLVNGQIIHCHKIEVDFDDSTIVIDGKNPEIDDGAKFDRESFFVSTITKEDLPD